MSDFFVVFSIGRFKERKTIFSYEKEGRFFLPIYTDSEMANAFQAAVKATYKNDIDLQANVCVEKNHLLDMLKTIASIHREPINVSINPNLVSGDCQSSISVVQEEHFITDYIEQIEDNLLKDSQGPA
jgi:hypothetical protein